MNAALIRFLRYIQPVRVAPRAVQFGASSVFPLFVPCRRNATTKWGIIICFMHVSHVAVHAVDLSASAKRERGIYHSVCKHDLEVEIQPI